MNVIVVGGGGAMGGWLVDFFDDAGWDVSIYDPESEDSVDKSDIPGHDVVVVSVPIDVTADVIEEVAPMMNEGLLMDVTSVKSDPLNTMLSESSDDVEVLGTHPMFGPSVRSIRGQTVIVVEGRPGDLSDSVISLFRNGGANVQFSEADEHDRMMSVVQGLTHSAYISIGGALREMEFDVDDSRRFMSPVYEIMLDFVGRILNQNPELYADIQLSQPVEEVHEALIDSMEEISGFVDRNDKEGFKEFMQDAAAHYGDTKSALRRSDKLIDANVEEYQELYDSVGKEVGLRHIYSEVVHVGVVTDVNGRNVVLEKGGDKIDLKIENVELMDEKELLRWRRDNLPRKEFDFSVVFSKELEPGVLEWLISEIDDRIVDVDLYEVYQGEAIPEGTTSHNFTVEAIMDAGVDEVIDEINGVLEGLGGSIRK